MQSATQAMPGTASRPARGDRTAPTGSGERSRLGEQWAQVTRRRNYMVAPELQYTIIRQLVLMFFAGAALALCGAYVVASMADFGGNSTEIVIAGAYVVTVLGAGLGFAFLLCVLFSHRVAGPATKISEALWRLSQGDVQLSLRLRKNDLLQELCTATNASIRNWRLFAQEMDRELLRVRGTVLGDPDAERAVARLQKIMAKHFAGTDTVTTTTTLGGRSR